MIKMKVTWGGSRDNGHGEIWMKFIAPYIEMAAVSKCVLLGTDQCFLIAKWNGKVRRIAVAYYNGKVDTPPHSGGEFRISFRSDRMSVDHAFLAELTTECAGTDEQHQKVFELAVMTLEEIEKKKGSPVVEEQEDEDAEEYEETDAEEEISI